MPGFHVENFGCRAARADGEAVSSHLLAAGYGIEQPHEADVVVVNTCSVTAEADRAARAYIRRAHRKNPLARIVVTGCYAQRAPEELAVLAGVAAVVGNSHKALAPQIAAHSMNAAGFVPLNWLLNGDGGAFSQGKAPRKNPVELNHVRGEARTLQGAAETRVARPGAPIYADDRFAHSFLEEAQLVPGEQTRPNLKIQEGCGNRCSFCVIPQTRGNSRSLDAKRILRQVEGFVAAGGNELVFSGINLGRWGRDLAPDQTLPGLVRRIFAETNLPRLRLSSIEPMDWDEGLIGLMAEFGGNRLARHAHLPLQSGSDAVLRRMHRRYRPWHYRAKVEALRRAGGPELTLGADVMVGFPGETDAEFEETVALIGELSFGYLHLFPFSPRPGTRAWALHAESPVPAAAVEERMMRLRCLAGEMSLLHRRKLVGRILDAITLHTPAGMLRPARTNAMTENFVPVEIKGQWEANRLLRICVTAVNSEGSVLAAAAE